MTTKPLLCIVTNRRRLAAARRCALADACALLLRQIEGAVAGGVDLVQIREADLDGRTLVMLVRDAVAIASGSAARVVVNERADIAIAAGAAGVHLRESSISTASAKRLLRDRLCGRSVHNAAGAAHAGPADYLVAGTLFSSASKSHSIEPIDLAGLAEIVGVARGIPVLAIGGIAADNARSAIEAGAAGVAAIGAFIPADPSGDLREGTSRLTSALRSAFESR